jgi:hypothetical protein
MRDQIWVMTIYEEHKLILENILRTITSQIKINFKIMLNLYQYK